MGEKWSEKNTSDGSGLNPDNVKFLFYNSDEALPAYQNELISISNLKKVSGAVTNVTYAEAVALQTAGTIVPGAVYRMTDFQTLHKIPGTSDRNDTNTVIPTEVLILTGRSATTFETRAYSEDFPNDIIEYTTDNTAWKDLAISGQKGCITLRIDPIRNIEVGNGDWRNFIVRRWKVDLSAYGRSNRWCLWAASTACGVLSTGAAQTFTAMNLNVYNASTNTDGYKDVNLLGDITNRVKNNIYIKKESFDNTSFQMPNFYFEVTGVTAFGALSNIRVNSCNNVSMADGFNNSTINSLVNTICTDFFLNARTGTRQGGFDSCFIAKALNGGGFEGISGVTMYDPIVNNDPTYFATFKNILSSYIAFINGSTTNNDGTDIILENIDKALISIQKNNGSTFRIKGFNFQSVVNNVNRTVKDISAFTTNVYYDKGTKSTIETTIAATGAIALSSATTSTVLDMFAGIINLTGTGTVNIDTVTRFLPNNFPVTLKPAAGLIISINQNNVANGFVNQDLVTANGDNGEVLILTPVADRWTASGNKIGAIATYTPADPATTTDTTGLMMGLGSTISFTPRKSGNALVVISGDIDNGTASNGSQVQIRFGTGTAPVNGAALTGTVAGGLVKMVNTDATTPGRVPFTLTSVLPLTVDVANWIDVSLASITGGTSRIRDISASVMER